MKLTQVFSDKAFNRTLFVLVLPLVVQQGITNFVTMLDNIMVGSLGTLSISAVSIVNQLNFVVMLTIFGGLSGISIFGAQYYGVRDFEGMRYTARMKSMFSVLIIIAASSILLIWGETFISLWLSSEQNSPEDVAKTLELGLTYLRVSLLGLPAFTISQAYVSSLRETGETVAPMKAGVVSVFVNLIGNYLLIFGHFGFPEMGVAGAALATSLARWIEAIYIVSHTHKHKEKYPFIVGVYSSAKLPPVLLKRVVLTGLPLMCSEILWSLGTTAQSSAFAVRGITAVAASNITSTTYNFFAVIMFSMGTAISILVGQRLGAADKIGAIETNTRLIATTFILHVAIGSLLALSSPLIPLLYKTEPAVRTLASGMLIVAGGALPINAVIHGCYFGIRSGGKTLITMLYDCGFMWGITVPLAIYLCNYTTLPAVWVYAAVRYSEIFKLFVGLKMVKSGFWVNTIID